MNQLELQFNAKCCCGHNIVYYLCGRSCMRAALMGREWDQGGIYYVVQHVYYLEHKKIFMGHWGDKFHVRKIFITPQEAWASLPERTDI